ncbi:MAG TPA: glycosyltransferase [Rubricoccaceae bacterium]|nr:glycosyltransferase [Rubricoccaceae bacterium]
MLLSTGIAPVSAEALKALRREGVRLVNFSTDDPWNPRHRAGWFLKALPHYDVVFTTRMANVEDFRRHGVRDVQYLPFGYDPRHCVGPEPDEAERERLACDVLFVGGADRDRAPVVRALVRAGLDVALYGGYWERHADLRAVSRGIGTPDAVRRATLAARVVLVLVRRANRDGHTMRSVEAGAIGACLLVEDTVEHRALYGPEGEAAVYFGSAYEMVQKARALLGATAERERLAAAVRERIRGGAHSYDDRLAVMLRHGIEHAR